MKQYFDMDKRPGMFINGVFKVGTNFEDYIFTEKPKNYNGELLEGINLLEGLEIEPGYKLAIIDLDMKDTNITNEQRNHYSNLTMNKFNIPTGYTEIEVTKNKGLHIFVLVKSEVLEQYSGVPKIIYSTTPKIEVEFFFRRKAVVTSPSKGYIFRDKAVRGIDYTKLLKMDSLPLFDVLEGNKKTSGLRTNTVDKTTVKKLLTIYLYLFDQHRSDSDFNSLVIRKDQTKDLYFLIRNSTGTKISFKLLNNGSFKVIKCDNGQENRIKNTNFFNLEELRSIYKKISANFNIHLKKIFDIL